MVLNNMLPESRGKTYIIRIVSVYSDLFKDKYGFYPTINFGRVGNLLKTLILNHTELQIAAMLIVFFDWAGMDGGSDFDREKLVNAAHSFGWFFSTTNQYEIFLRNIQKVDMDSEDDVREFVSRSLIALKN